MRSTFVPVLPAVPAQNAATNFTSPAIAGNQLNRISLQANMAGATSTGVFQLQASNDAIPGGTLSQGTQPTNWTNIGSALTFTTPGALMIPSFDVAYGWYRVVYTATGSVGTVVATFYGIGWPQ